MKLLQGILSLGGRVMLSAIFLLAAVGNKIPHYDDTLKLMESKGIPQPSILLPGAIAFLIVGSLSVIVGFKARFGAFLLAVFLGMATYYFHDFWNLPEDQQRDQMTNFMKNAGLFGAMLFIMANGAGAMSIDKCRECKNPPA